MEIKYLIGLGSQWLTRRRSSSPSPLDWPTGFLSFRTSCCPSTCEGLCLWCKLSLTLIPPSLSLSSFSPLCLLLSAQWHFPLETTACVYRSYRKLRAAVSDSERGRAGLESEGKVVVMGGDVVLVVVAFIFLTAQPCPPPHQHQSRPGPPIAHVKGLNNCTKNKKYKSNTTSCFNRDIKTVGLYAEKLVLWSGLNQQNLA